MIKCSSPSAIRSLNVYKPSLACYSTRPIARCLVTANVPLHRGFHASRTVRATEQSHYDTLGVAPNASKADLKKRFYVLSKETHPDVAANRGDPSAADRFSKVSEAYAVLGNEEKRKIYDRDVMPRFTRRSQRSSSGQSGTYAGSRPATGLSKRRGTFRGPPPSFYADKNPSPDEQARREQEAYNAGAPSGSQTYAGAFDPSAYTSAGQWDPTFNPTPVYKTQTAEDHRRNHRRAAEMAAAQAYADEESNLWVKFIVVSGVIGFAVGVGTMVNRMNASPRGSLVRGDGTRRSQSKERLTASTS